MLNLEFIGGACAHDGLFDFASLVFKNLQTDADSGHYSRAACLAELER